MYVQLVLSRVILCVVICLCILFKKLVFNQGPMEDHLSVNGLPRINIRNKQINKYINKLD